MTGPQQSRPSPAPGGTAGGEASRPSPRPRHGRLDEDTGDGFPENSYQGEGYPDLRPSGPLERPAPWTRGGYPDPPLYGEHGATDPGAAQRYPGSEDDTPERGSTPSAAAYGDPARHGSSTRGGLAIDGGPPYTPASRPGAAEDTEVAVEPATVAAPERETAASAIPAQRDPAQRDPADARARPTTVAEAAAARGLDRGPAPAGERGAPDSGTGGGGNGDRSGDPSRPGRASAGPAEVRVARDSRALTVLRVITYVLVSLCCLVFLAGVVYAGISYLEFRESLNSSPFLPGFPGAG
ncbi:hypothetical protein ACLFMI_23805 [Pseudonocardia nantongensis]|uniref:hypothetical protein n=1 Tax=Pseudonocardia nantongensis TaxID=1181885 RepID=UPI00397C3B03